MWAKFIKPSTFPLSDAFWQIPLDFASKAKTAFVVSGKGFVPVYSNAVWTTECSSNPIEIDQYSFGCSFTAACFCLDNIVTCSNEFERHLELLEEAPKRIRSANLTVGLKSKFCCKRLKYLGHIGGRSPKNERIEAMVKFPPIFCPTGKVIIWFVLFSFTFVTKVIVEQKPESAFGSIKSCLGKVPVVIFPDYNRPFYMQCDASAGKILKQIEGGQEQVIAYISQ